MAVTSGYSSTSIPSTHKRRNNSPLRTVGILAPHYGLEHLSYLMRPAGYRFATLKRVPFHRLNHQNSFLQNTALLANPTVDIIHTLNMLPMNGKKFIASFELEMPRYLEAKQQRWQQEVGQRSMRSKRCKALLSLSDVGAHLLRQRYDDLADKIGVFRGAIAPSSYAPTNRRYRGASEPLRLLFVGGEALRKGLSSVLAAADGLRKAGAAIELTVISALRDHPVCYVAGHTEKEKQKCLAQLQEFAWVTHYEKLANTEVRRLMANHDLLLLPSFDETLGWVIAEAAMEATASITTDIFAFPELIDHKESGYMLSLEKQKQNRWHGLAMSDEQRTSLYLRDSILLANQLQEALRLVFDDRSLAQQWGQNAYEKISAMYHPETSGKTLQKIYDTALV